MGRMFRNAVALANAVVVRPRDMVIDVVTRATDAIPLSLAVDDEFASSQYC